MNRKNKLKVLSFYLSMGIVGLLFFKILLISIKDNPVTLQTNKSSSIDPLFRQSWAFFTRNPREEKIQIYQLKGTELILLNHKNTLPSNLFGIIKKNRLVSHYINTKYDEIPKKMLYDFRGKLSYNLIKKLLNEGKLKTLKLNRLNYWNKGKYLIVESAPIPWAWHSSIKKPVLMPSKLILFTLKNNSND